MLRIYCKTYKLSEFIVVQTSVTVCVGAFNDSSLYTDRQLHAATITQSQNALHHFTQWDTSLSLILTHTVTTMRPGFLLG